MALTGAATPGNVFAPAEHANFVFDRLAASSVMMQAGIRLVRTTRHSLDIPKIVADPDADWVSEGGTISPSDPDAATVTANPRKLASLVVVSNELLDDSDPAVRGILGEQLARALALKLDLGILEGSGTAPEIEGIKNVTGISEAAIGPNGAVPTNLDSWATAISALQQANAEATAIVMHPRDWGVLSKLKEATGSERPLVVDAAGAPTEGPRRSIYGVPVHLTSQLSTNEVQGTSGGVCSSSYIVQADQVVLVQRAQVEIEVDSSRLFNSYQSEVRAVGRFDVAVPNPLAVYRIKGIKAA